MTDEEILRAAVMRAWFKAQERTTGRAIVEAGRRVDKLIENEKKKESLWQE